MRSHGRPAIELDVVVLEQRCAGRPAAPRRMETVCRAHRCGHGARADYGADPVQSSWAPSISKTLLRVHSEDRCGQPPPPAGGGGGGQETSIKARLPPASFYLSINSFWWFWGQKRLLWPSRSAPISHIKKAKRFDREHYFHYSNCRAGSVVCGCAVVSHSASSYARLRDGMLHDERGPLRGEAVPA